MTQSAPGTGSPDGGGLDPQAKVAEVTGQAQEKAQQAAGHAQDKLREQIDQRSAQVAKQIGEQAADLRSVSEALREQGKDGPAKAADQLARYAEKVCGYLTERDSHRMLADAEDLGRRQPWAAAAGGVALGFAASRFLKASSRQRYQGPSGPRPAYTPASPAPSASGIGDWAEPSALGSSSGPVI